MTQALMESAGAPDRARREALFRALDAVAAVVSPGQLRAVAYLRVSTEEQTKGYGISYTGKRVVHHIAKKGWALVDVFADEGYSGSLPAEQRPDLAELLRQANQSVKPFDVVVVYEERAIGRAGRAFWPWVWRLQDIGIFTAIVRGDYDNTSDDGESRMRKAADRAEDELVLIRDRTQGGIQDKAEVMADESGYLGGVVPYGYKVIGRETKGESRLVPDDEDCGCAGECERKHEADGVRLAAARYMATLSYERTAADMNAAGFRRKSGKLWEYKSVHNLLNSDVILEGTTTHRGSKDVVLDKEGKPRFGAPVTIKLTRILSDAEVARLKEARAKRPTRRAPKAFVYTLAGRIKTPCGRMYAGGGKSRIGDKNGRSPFKALKCGGNDSAIPKDQRCGCPIIRAEPVEREAWRLVKEFLQDPDELVRKAEEALAARNASRADFGKRLKELNKRIGELEESIDLMLMAATQQAAARRMSRTDAEAYIQKMTGQSNTELADLQRQRADIERWQQDSGVIENKADQLRTLAERAQERLENKSLEEQAELFDLLQAEVTLLSEVPSRPLGRPCQVVALFVERGLKVPLLTDEAWAAVEGIVPAFTPRFSSREVLEGFLEKARTGDSWKALKTPVPHTTLMNHWIRWGASGGLAAVAERLAEFPGVPAPDHDKVVVQVRCTVMPQLLLGESGSDGNVTSSSTVGSGGGSRGAFNFSVLLAA